MNDSNARVSLKQRCQVHQAARRADAFTFFNLLTGDKLLDTVESLLPPHRERLFSPTETLAMFSAQAMSADRSCQKAVDEASVNRLVTGLPSCSTATGGYCRARQRLPVSMVSTLTRTSGHLMASRSPLPWQWQGRRVRLVDGTTVAMPDTPANQAAYRNPVAKNPAWASRYADWWVWYAWPVALSWTLPSRVTEAREPMSKRFCEPCWATWMWVTSCSVMPFTPLISCCASYSSAGWMASFSNTGHADAARISAMVRSWVAGITSWNCRSQRLGLTG